MKKIFTTETIIGTNPGMEPLDEFLPLPPLTQHPQEGRGSKEYTPPNEQQDFPVDPANDSDNETNNSNTKRF